MSKLCSLIKRIFTKPIVKFGIVGIISNIINYITYSLSLFLFSLNISVLNGYFIGFIFSYFGNKNWTFELKYKNKSQLIIEKLKFFVLHILSLILMVYLVNFFKNEIEFNYSVSWFFAAIPVALFNYYLTKKIFS